MKFDYFTLFTKFPILILISGRELLLISLHHLEIPLIVLCAFHLIFFGPYFHKISKNLFKKKVLWMSVYMVNFIHVSGSPIVLSSNSSKVRASSWLPLILDQRASVDFWMYCLDWERIQLRSSFSFIKLSRFLSILTRILLKRNWN